MCGITGFIDFKSKSHRDVLGKMTQSLAHRGPDGEGTSFYQKDNFQIGLGHRRLSIIDLSNHATQPMSMGNLHIVFNGEIYNYKEIKKELIDFGHQFITQSDTEVILHAWQEWGEEAIKMWRGMFAIALYDENQNQMIFIRDRAGVKPFYYYYKNGLFIFGSELKAILQHPNFKKEINLNAVASFLQHGYVAHPHCIYQDTYKLSPGHILKLDLANNSVKINEYWSVYDSYDQPKLNISLPEAILETESVLEKAFQYRMVSDVPVGVFLSGGYDSTCVAALLQKSSSQKIKTFTIGSTDKNLDEAPFAKIIANHLGTNHTEYYCSAKESLDIIADLPFYFDEPFADSSAIPTMLVSKMAKQDVTVALSADAGDEIFAGYNRYGYIAKYGKKIRSVPKPLRSLVAATMNKLSSESIPYLKNQYNFHGRYDKLKNLLIDPSTSELLKNLTQTFTNKEIKEIFNDEVIELETGLKGNHSVSAYDDLSFMMAVDYQTYLVDDILQKVDRATMSVGLEGREPFLDQHIIEWAAKLPSEYKYYKGEKKYILKQIVHKHVPKEIMERPKMGFSIPIEKWLSNELKDLIDDYLSEEKLNEHKIFKSEKIKALLKFFYDGRKEKHLQIWYLLMFQMWYEKWIKN